MLEINIPGFGLVSLEYFVTDFTGTLSVDGVLLPGIRSRLKRIALLLQIHVITADTFGSATVQMKEVPCEVHIIKGTNQDVLKENFLRSLKANKVVALGNGNNDRRMLKAARLGIAVINSEGCSIQAMAAADIFVLCAQDGLDLLLNPERLKATLRF
jgi:soluble P-type ATPase